jgi:hypothetical protein
VLTRIGAADLRGTGGFGDFAEPGRGRWSRSADFLAAPLGDAWSVLPRRLEGAVLRELESTLADCLAACPEERRPVHGDFGSKQRPH